MKRKALEELLLWNTNSQMPIAQISGARGVGKTYLALEFAQTFYEKYHYINFEFDFEARNSFSKFQAITLSKWLKEQELSLIILDEITFLGERASQVLELLTQVLKKSKSQPKILIISDLDFSKYSPNLADIFDIHLYPLDFEEFLLAIGKEWYIPVIKEHYVKHKKLPDIVHNELFELFELYLVVGGMPAVICEYVITRTTYNTATIQQYILHQYDADINKTTLEADRWKKKQCLLSLPIQLSKVNKKFQYRYIRKGATEKQYAQSVQDLLQCGLVLKTSKLANDTDKTKSCLERLDETNFKLYLLDVGLLFSAINSNLMTMEEEVRKGMIENYVVQALEANGYHTCFWESKSQAKIDFVIQKGNQIIPIEVRIDDNTRSKNISIFKTQEDFEYSIKISTKNFDFHKNTWYVPLYAVFCIR